jgi:hypothetical protein
MQPGLACDQRRPMAGELASHCLGHAKRKTSNFVIGAWTRAARRTTDSIGGARSNTYPSENPAQGELHGVLAIQWGRRTADVQHSRAPRGKGAMPGQHWSIKSGSVKLITAEGDHDSRVGNAGWALDRGPDISTTMPWPVRLNCGLACPWSSAVGGYSR